MVNKQGMIVLMGSGELTATMVEVHKALLRQLGSAARAVFIDTPAGFQLNVDQISDKARDYFDARVQHPLSIVSIKSADSGDPVAIEKGYAALREADYILIGPGSPTYALRQWVRTQVPELITQRILAGGCLVAASAAALTVGRLTLPVYEIYKVGHRPYWEQGLNILQTFGFDWVVLPHWNNAEGGNHDTRYCFMGEPRLRKLESLMPDSVTLVGLDEHTALVIDFSSASATIRGIGKVTLRRRGVEQVFAKGETLPLALLRGEAELHGTTRIVREQGNATAQRQEHGGSASAPVDRVWDPVRELAETVSAQITNNRIEQATSALLELEAHIWGMREALQERGAMGDARAAMRDMLTFMGTQMALRPQDQRACLQPLVEQIVELRTRCRQAQQWEIADALRDCLARAGVVTVDTPEGVEWRFEQ
jgi:peptidase E